LDWGCSKCKGEGWEDGDSKRAARGCDGEPTSNLGFAFAPSLRRCPWASIEPDVWQYISWWLNWEAFKVLPWGGNDLMAQPAFVFEVFELCEVEKRSRDLEQHKAQRARIKNGR